MFDLRRPCVSCPFRKGQGELYQIEPLRLAQIFEAVAFQCHKTVDYANFDDDERRQGDKPQQCAGLMSLLHRAGKPNQIMQVGERLGAFNPDALDHGDVYETMDAARAAHLGARR